MSAEALVRQALRARVLGATDESCHAVDEFWVPRSNERADLAVVGPSMDGYEIKTERDNLRRLPRQIEAYGRLFDRCSVVLAEKHLDAASDFLPPWWGVLTVRVNGSVSFAQVRSANSNPEVDPEILVRLLWKEEVINALETLGAPPKESESRAVLWQRLLELASPNQLRAAVRRALLHRDPSRARIATRRFKTRNPQLGAWVANAI